MTNDDFDPEMLRRLDAPRRPSPAGTESIRAAMLAAFDDEADRIDRDASDEGGDIVWGSDTSLVEPERSLGSRHLEIALDPNEDRAHDAAPERRQQGRPAWQLVRYAAVAAAVAAAIAGTVALRSNDRTVELVPGVTTDSDIDAVRQFCLDDVDPLVDDLAAFVARPGGELSDRGLRNSELLAQRYRDLAPLLSDDLSARVVADGDLLLQQAADARRSGDDGVIIGLVDDTVRAIAVLPGSDLCRLDNLRDSSS